MTTEIQESIPAEGSAGSPNPSASQGSGVQPTSGLDADQLLKLVEPLIEKKVQSVKDRRFDEQEKRIGAAESVLERVKDLIPEKDFKELKKDLRIEELERRVYGDAPTGAPAAAPQTSAATDMQKVIQELQLDANDPSVAKVLRETSDPVRLAMQLGQLKGAKVASQPDPSLAPTVNGTNTTPSGSEFQAAYLKEMNDARGKGYAVGNAIKAKYREKGVPVDDLLLSV